LIPWQFATGIIDTGGKFATVSATPAEKMAKFAPGVVDTGGAPLLANISVNFQKNSKSLVLFSGHWGKMIHEKNLKRLSL
jgi:hypothetical protein